ANHPAAAGLRVGMGVDGQASADISDPFENVRFGLYALRIRRENSGGLQPIDVLRLHTLKTAGVLGVQRDVGSREVGKVADGGGDDVERPFLRAQRRIGGGLGHARAQKIRREAGFGERELSAQFSGRSVGPCRGSGLPSRRGGSMESRCPFGGGSRSRSGMRQRWREGGGESVS
ncbi:MAG: hypothetical protein CFE26_26845, partial [Verrucomicrobiales bacterium VVV1]